MDGLDFTGKVALVSAGTRGIGESIASNLARLGATVVAFSRSAERSETRGDAGLVVTISANGADGTELEAVVRMVLERFGRIDILVNNTGGVPYVGPVLDAEPSVWDSMMDVNLRSTFLLTRLVVKNWMAAHGGAIVNIASIGGLRSSGGGLGIYGVAKAAMIRLTRQLARELAPNHIRVNAIAPGLIKTEFSRGLWENPQILQAILSANPSGRLGTADDVARAATFLVSEAADYINGETLVVDGGGLA